MISESLKGLIKDLENIAGTCIYDEDDAEYGTLELYLDEYGDVGIEIDTETLRVSPFVSFSYYDFSKTDIDNGHYEIEELESEILTKLLESSFILYLKSHSPNYTVSVWDDGSFMCPGYVARVGFSGEKYTTVMVKEFLDLCQEFWSSISNLNDSELRKYIFKSICHNHGIKLSENENISFGNAILRIGDYKNLPENNVEYHYIGEEKFLFSVAGEHYAADVCPIQVFMEAHDMCELFDDVIFSLDTPPLFDSSVLRITGPHMELTIQAYRDENHLYAQIEESAAVFSCRDIVPFASEKFKEVYYSAYSSIMDLYSGPEPLIITEGSTDWKHLKKYWEQYMQENLKIHFWEYEPANSPVQAKIKQEMGSRALLETCKAYSRMALGKVFIFIADCDEPKIVKEMGGEAKRYKDWGNNVYSFVLPVPPHRSTSPEICIEHYYSDEEIKAQYKCDDGRERRLFLGNDFDQFGRNFCDGLMCVKRNLCGPDSIKVIDGSSDTRVISMSEESDVNYALSKQDFARFSKIIAGSPTYNAFREVFVIIQSIIDDSKKRGSEKAPISH